MPLLSALGSYEAYGANKNSDAFPRIAFTEDKVHKTYEEFGYPYKHHLNKPDRGHPQYGDKVSLAEFNEKMDRVELVVWYDLSRDTNLLSDIERGSVGVSMGFKAKFDTCSICGAHAKKLSDYCEHAVASVMGMIPPQQLPNIKRPLSPYRLGYILPDGRKVFRYNRYGRFFDISRVLIPAWRPGRIMEKVAFSRETLIQVPEKYDTIPSSLIYLENNMVKVAHSHDDIQKVSHVKKASSEKTADIYKKVPSLDEERKEKVVDLANQCEEIKSTEPEIPQNTLQNLAEKKPLKSILASLLSLGIMPKPKEFQRIVLIKLGKQELADRLDKYGIDFMSTMGDPSLTCDDINFSHDDVDMEIIEKVAKFIPDRSCFVPFLYDRLEKIANKGMAPINDPIPPMFQGEPSVDPTRGATPTLTMLAGLYLALKGKIIGVKRPSYKGKPIMPDDKILGEIFGKNFLAKAIKKHPAIAATLLSAAGVGLVAGINRMSDPRIKGQMDMPLDTPYTEGIDHTNYLSSIQKKNEMPFTKIGAFDPVKTSRRLKNFLFSTGSGATAARLIAGAPALYITSNVLRRKKYRDPYSPEGNISSFIRKHPGLSTAAFAFGPHAARTAFALGKDYVKGMSKTGSDWSELRDFAIWGALMPKRVAANVAAGVTDALIFKGIGKAMKALGNKKNSQPGLALPKNTRKQTNPNYSGGNHGDTRRIMPTVRG